MGQVTSKMPYRNVLLFFVIILSIDFIHAQDDVNIRMEKISERERFSNHVDSLFDIGMERKQKRVDTLYVQPARNFWTLKARTNFSGTNIHARSFLDEEQIDTRFESTPKATISFAAAYRGISLGFAINPAHLTGKNNDLEINLNSYGNRVGGEIIYRSTKRLTGSYSRLGTSYDIPSNLTNQNALNANVYYIFNHKRFSYPAALSQTYTQRRSCGSWLIGVSVLGEVTKTAHDENLSNPDTYIRTENIGLGVGYAYNLVTRHHWLFHLSAQPSLVIYGKTKMTVNGENVKLSSSFPEILHVGRIAIIHSFKNYFTGITAVVNTSLVGDHDKLDYLTNRWRVRLVYGIRL